MIKMNLILYIFAHSINDNMTKRILSITLLLLANLILVAHEIVPHHHHDDHICIENHACEASSNHESNNTKHTDNDQCCLLKDINVITVRHFDLREEMSLSLLKHLDYNSSYILVETLSGINKYLIPYVCHKDIFRQFLFSEYVNHAIGLRAPPLS
jgi:hypothetical protein